MRENTSRTDAPACRLPTARFVVSLCGALMSLFWVNGTAQAQTADFGDYNAFGSASSTVVTTLKIGATTDKESTATTNATATGDDTTGTDDEDGVTIPTSLAKGIATSMTVNVTNTTGSTAYLNVWIDFNRNGVLTDSGEQVAANTTIATGTSNSNRTVNFTVPAAASLGTAGVRVRLTSTSTPGATTVSGNGEVEDVVVTIIPNTDFGDYPSFSSASQIFSADIKIGTNATDSEASNPTTGAATADDTTATDDEELVMPALTAGTGTTLAIPVTVTTASLSGSTARLNVFADWNGDNDVADTNETLTAQTVGASGTFNFTLTPPAGTAAGTKYLRIRITEGSTAPTFSGTAALKGEVEDHAIVVRTHDFGDFAPFASASSMVNGTLRIGTSVDAELTATTNATATGDDTMETDDENGVTVPGSVVLGTASSLTVNVTNTSGSTAYLNAWIDFNGNGVLTDSGEQIAANTTVATGTSNSNRTVNFTVPATATPGGAGVRVRFTSTSSPGPDGADGNGEVEDYVMTLACPTVALSPITPAVPTVGTAYSQTVSAAGSTTTFNYAVTAGALPAGLSLDTNTGVLSGTPTSSAAASFTITATGANGCAGSQAYSLTPVCDTVSLTPDRVSVSYMGSAYSQTLTASGGTAPYTYAVSTGTLPTGLSLSAAGVLSGTPTTSNGAGASVTIRATDIYGCQASRTYAVVVCPAITVNPSSAASAVVGTGYSQTFSGSGGASPYTFAVSSGVLPAWATLNPSTGVITGTPNNTTSASFTIRATDANGCQGTRSYTITPACPAITVNPATLPNGVAGFAYNQTLSGGSGTAPYTFAVTSGALPAGLSLNTTSGVISGTPVNGTAGTFTIRAMDNYGCTGTRSYTITPVNIEFGDWNGSGAATITASTIRNTNIRLGASVDAEVAATTNASATADDLAGTDDEDGVAIPASMTQGASVTIPVNVFNNNTAGRYLQGWIDFNNDGTFNNTDVAGGGERIYNAAVSASASSQTINVTFTVPASASVGLQRGARFRFTDNAATTPTSSGANGETEDYSVTIVSPPVTGGTGLAIVQEWFVPQPEAQIREDYLVLAPKVNAITDSVITVTVPIAATKVVFDHWEDGYEVDLKNPVQPSTLIWGDGNDANGKPPGYANDPASFSAGSVITMRNNVTLPRNASALLYDGRDRLGSTYGVVMTRAAWFTDPGPLLANSVEVRAVNDWGTTFVLPVGEDVIYPTPLSSSMFEHCSAYIMAAQNGTTVQIDKDANGVMETTVTLNMGESYLINAGIKKGARITTSKPAQVIEFFGDINANFETRGANVPALEKWSSDYYAPVGTAADGDDTQIFLYNPDASAAITINYVTQVGSGSFAIPAKSTYRYLMPQNSGAQFTSVGSKPFWGVGTVGAEANQNNVHDWGYALVPKEFLSTVVVVGWGAGSDDGTQNGSPIWVTPTKSTTIYVDYNGDRNGPLTDSSGQKYDLALNASALSVSRVYESDKNQTGTRLYTLDGTNIIGAWGQDPATAGPARPYLDLGNTLPNYPVPVISKVSSLALDNSPTGPSAGDILEYTITFENKSLFALSTVSIVDILPTAQLAYVRYSTTRDGISVSDNGSTPFPLDESGLVIPVLSPKESTVIKFRATIIGTGTITNVVSAGGIPGVTATDVIVVPVSGSSSICTLDFTNNTGGAVIYQTGDGIYVTVNNSNANTASGAVETVTASILNNATGDAETITLAETGANTGVFRNTTPLPSSTNAGLNPSDGTLNAQAGHAITATHVDGVSGNPCTDTTTIAAPSLIKQLYLDADSADGDMTGELDRVDPVATGDSIASKTATLSAAGASAITAAATTTGSNTSVAAGGSLSFSHTPGSGANRLLLVAVAVGNNTANDADPAPGVVTGVTFGGVAMTQVAAAYSGAAVRTYIYRLVNPSSSAANVVVSIGTTASSVTASATTFNGVDQTTPLGATSNFVATGGDYFVTGTFTSAADELVYSSVAVDEYSSVNQGVSSGAGQTQLWNNSGFDFVSGAASTKPGAASVSLRYDFLDYEDGVIAAVSIKPAAGATGDSATWTQTPAFAETFTMPAGGNLGVTAFAEFPPAVLPATPAITATLKNGGVTVATLDSPSATLVSGTGGQPVTLDATSSSQKRAGTGTGTTPTFSSHTWSHTTGTGSNRLLLVGVSLESDSQGTTVSSVTYSGQSLTRAGFQQSIDNEARMEIWRLINPPSGTANVVVTLNQACDDALVVVASTFSGVHQTTPLGTFASAQSDQGDLAPQPSLSLASASGELVFDMLALDDADSVTSPGGGQTQRLNLTQGDSDSGITGAASTKAGASSVSLSWATSPDSWALGAVPIKPATTGSSIYRLDWNTALASAVSLTSGQSLSLTIENSGEADFSVLYDSSTYPSKVSLPTNTVIHTDSITVYDAPYPGGSATTAPDLGEQVYVRVTVGDPFGAYDITTVPFTIDAPGTASDVSATLTVANVVGTTAATKTYQYVWTAGSVEGPVTITATAKEGYENTITSAKSAIVTLSALDLGTPGFAVFTTGSNGAETSTYALNEQVAVRVTDIDQNVNPAVAETLLATITSSSGDSEQITLTETGVNTGVFVLVIPVSSTIMGTNNNGTLYVPAGAVLTVSYVDPTDPTDTSNATAATPALTPAVSVDKTLLSPADGQITVGETAQYRIRVTNTGNTTLNTVQVVDTFPAASLSYVSASVTPNTVAGGSLTWTNLGPLNSGQSVDVLVNFTGLAAANPAINVVNVTTGGGPTAASNAPVIVTRPAVTLTKTLLSPNPGPANKGDSVVFNLTLQNTGTTTLTTLPLEDTFSDANFDFVFATITPDSTGAGSLVWNDVTDSSSLGVGETFTVTVTLRAKGNANPATNNAAITNAFDANGDPVPPSSSAASLQLLAATISGSVYEDKGTTGFGGGDTGLEEVTVTLFSDPNADGDPVDGSVQAITTTNSTGYYEFLNLAAGRYVVVQENLPTYVNIADTGGANDNRIPVNVTTLTSYPNNNFLDIIPIPLDFGDWNGGGAATTTASTVMTPNIRLGESVDSEDSVTPNATAAADGGDEDGVVMPASITPGTSVTIPVTVFNFNTANRYLQGWIDFNNDGTFSNTDVTSGGERIYNAVVPANASAQTINVTFTVPSTARLGAQRGVRFRFTNNSSTTPVSSGASGETEDYTVAVNCPAISISPASLPAAVTGTSYSSTLSATPSATYSWQVVQGTLPAGLSLNAGSGLISGTPTLLGRRDFTVKATTGANTTPELEFTTYNLDLNPGDTFNIRDYVRPKDGTTKPIDWSAVRFTYTDAGANDPTTPANWNLTAFNAGQPVTVTSTDAALGGNSSVGSFRIYIVRDGQSIFDDHMEIRVDPSRTSLVDSAKAIPSIGEACSATRDYSINVCPVITLSPVTWTQPMFGFAYSQTASATGGSAPYVYSIASGSLPAGLSFDPGTGVLSGTPTSTTAATFTMTATDANGCVVSRTYTVTPLANTDFGDLSILPNASSTFNSRLKMGALLDTEVSATTNTTATGDDITVSDDEDGVTMPASITAGSTVTIPVVVTNTTGSSAYLNAWIDFGANSDLSNAGDQIATNIVIPNGTNAGTVNVTFNVPVAASVGAGRGVRFRLTDIPTPGFSSSNSVGEVEDYITTIAAPTLDFGDFNLFPSATSVANNRLRIGALVDVEGQATINATATGDDTTGSDDEDGVTVPASITQGTGTSLTVNVTNTIGSTAYLNAWIDFNGNGVLTDAGEQIASNTAIANSTSNSNRVVNFTVPAVVKTGTVGVRVRLTNTSSPGPDGQDGSGEVEDVTTSIVANTDFGDFSSFPSASSKTNATLRIGSLTDSEGGLDTDANAAADDLNGTDDEDGVTVPVSIAQGAASSLTVNLTNTSGSTAYLNAWIDFNRNGILTDTGEQVAVNTAIVTGTSNADNVINFTAPVNASLGKAGIRVRLTSVTTPGADGLDGNGEVEDHTTMIVLPTTDFGDELDLANASSTISGNLHLGALVDAEGSPTKTANADGDDAVGMDDEDGLSFPSVTAGQPVTLPVTVTNLTGAAGYLNAWIDFNNNGVLTDAGEQVVTNVLVPSGTNNDTLDLDFSIPTNAVTAATSLGTRFRLTDIQNPGPTGQAGVGEVEDHPIVILAPLTDFGDFNGAPEVSNTASTNLRLGTLVDTEYASTRNATASGDDSSGVDDEDGVTLPSMIAGAPATITTVVTNNTGLSAYLNAWIDFNNNGVFTDLGEQVATNSAIANGTSNATRGINLTVPPTAVTGASLGVRVRISNDLSPGSTGAGGVGEVEDYVINIAAPTTDFGDFTSFGSASSTLNAGIRLGASIDTEYAATTNVTASGDDNTAQDDEDGVVFPAMTAGAPVTLPVVVTNTSGANAYLNVWIDFNNNGSIADAGEQVATNVLIATGAGNATQNLSFTVPAASLTGVNLGARFRLTSTLNPGVSGGSGNGEVEDHLVSILAPTTDFGDFSGFADASQGVNPALRLGALQDPEFVSTRNATATGDDAAGVDDEDGVVLPSMIAGQTVDIPVTATNETGANGFLNLWIDYNNNGVLTDTGEQIATNHIIPTGATNSALTFTITVPQNATTGVPLGVRARLSAPSGLGPVGNNALAGEIEDYALTIAAPTTDFGDHSSLSSASSTMNSNLLLGTAVDAEYAATTSVTAMGDDSTGLDDEDGVVVPASLDPGASVTLPVTVKNNTGASAWLHAWIDFNNDGVLNNATLGSGGERLEAARAIASQATASTQNITFTVPLIVNPGSNRAVRFRLTNSSATTPAGASGSGEVEDYATVITSATNDFGDWSGAAVASNGVSSSLFLGAQVDAEYLATINATATGDDSTDTDDEDGVALPALIAGGSFNVPVTVTNLTGAAASLNAWIDFNNNGVFTDTGEQVIVNLAVANGSSGLVINPSVTVPTTAVTGTNVGVRFRLTTTGTPGATGSGGGAGEVEDYAASIAAPTADQGDNSRFAAASSTSSNALRMGTLVDAEYIAITNLTATGDDTTGVDDEDGVTLPSLMAGAPATLPVVVTNSTASTAYLNAWIDFNNNGVLTDAGEQVATNVAVATGTSNASLNLAFTVPPTALTGVSLGLRVRLTSVSAPGATGQSGTGEVEDYVITISPPPLDYGDWNGLADAASTVDAGLRLGTLADTEFASTPTPLPPVMTAPGAMTRTVSPSPP
jgi:uncharacterized repeat protein (TIGR01451 family)